MSLDPQSREILALARVEAREEWTPERAQRVIAAVQDRLEHEGAAPRRALELTRRPALLALALVSVFGLTGAGLIALVTRSGDRSLESPSAVHEPPSSSLDSSDADARVEVALAQLERVREQLEAGHHAEALAALRDDGSGMRELFTEETWILEARARCGAGERAAGRALLERFRQRYGETAFQVHARGACDP